jgi:hypothetical protein
MQMVSLRRKHTSGLFEGGVKGQSREMYDLSRGYEVNH